MSDRPTTSPTAKRLFVAIEVPPFLSRVLATRQPEAGRHIRLIPREQMHLTLHFVGNSELGPVDTALRAVRAPRLELAVHGFGKFASTRGADILWAGVREQQPLIDLHRQMDQHLRAAGFPTETRHYTPHITLARCRRDVPAEVIERFLDQPVDALPNPWRVDQFSLYSSDTHSGLPQYTLERHYPLGEKQETGMAVNVPLAQYLAAVPETRRARVLALHQLILDTFPEAETDMRYKMPTYRVGEGWVALANQKQYISLYTCGPQHIARFKAQHPEIKTGQGCINFRARDPLPLEALREVIQHAMNHPKGH